MTKIVSAQAISVELTVFRAFVLVPADFTLRLGCFRQMVSAVGLRHWFLLQMNNIFLFLAKGLVTATSVTTIKETATQDATTISIRSSPAKAASSDESNNSRN